jgi:hypothetical protein
VARELNVKPAEVIEMETRLAGGDVALEPQTTTAKRATRPSPTWPTTRTSRRARWKPAAATGWPATASCTR